MSAQVTFTTGFAVTRDYFVAAGAMDEMPPFAPCTRVFSFDQSSSPSWTKHDEEWRVARIWSYFDESDNGYICLLSVEGDIKFLSEDTPITEKIPGAGVFSEDAGGWGYMNCLRQIGDHLYACGDGGQVYKRLGPDSWQHMDAALIQTPPVNDRLQLNSINGLTENDIYLSGDFPGPAGLEGKLFHFDGSDWRPLPIPEVGYLNSIHIESPERIWVCGHNGALLLGNARDGFKDLSSVEDNQLFYSLTLFNGKVYLASNLGLFAYDPADLAARIRKVITGLMPELQDAHVVDACDGVLWSIGEKDIARFDGKQWVRVDHPDNPPIR